jgi:hypothetical protein
MTLDVATGPDRPADDTDEIEVTPEMIEAGVAELKHFNPDFDRAEDAVRWIFEAMELNSRARSRTR